MENRFDKIDEKFDKVYEKLDRMNEGLNQVDKQMSVYNEQLKLHIKRTEMLEAEIKPIKSHVTLMNNLAKIILFIGVLAAIYKNLR